MPPLRQSVLPCLLCIAAVAVLSLLGGCATSQPLPPPAVLAVPVAPYVPAACNPAHDPATPLLPNRAVTDLEATRDADALARTLATVRGRRDACFAGLPQPSTPHPVPAS